MYQSKKISVTKHVSQNQTKTELWQSSIMSL